MLALLGVNVTWTEQLVLIASDAGHVLLPFTTAKSPLAVIDWICRATPPVLVICTVCGELVVPATVAGKVAGEGENVAAAGASPVPVSVSVALPPETPEAGNVSTPLRVPVACGLKVTEIVQLAPGPSEEPHVVELPTMT